jgi:hypothetical protein
MSKLKRSLFGQAPSYGWVAIVGLILVSTASLFAGGKILNLAFPSGALLVGAFLYFRYPLLYVGFTWWIWFLSPLVRRMADYRGSFTDPSPILLTPYLVTLLSLVTVLRHLPTLRRQGGLPFLLSLSGVFYSFLIGIINVPPAFVFKSLLDWLTPIAFGCHLFLQWQDYPLYRQNIQRVFLWCVLLTGSYGVFQYLSPFEWDKVWLANITEQLGIVTFGKPEPLGIRVWSTMHGPLVFASVMGSGLLLLLSRTGALFLPATAVGYLSFLLSLARTAWLGWIIGILILLTSLKQSLQIRLFMIILVVGICTVSLSMIEPFSEVIGNRVSSLADVKSDNSVNERLGSYQGITDKALTNFLGDGLTSGPGSDSGVIDILIRLGWLGGACYVTGLGLLLFQSVKVDGLDSDLFAKTAHAIALGTFAQMPLGSVSIALPGMILWSFLGIKLAAFKYYKNQHRCALERNVLSRYGNSSSIS